MFHYECMVVYKQSACLLFSMFTVTQGRQLLKITILKIQHLLPNIWSLLVYKILQKRKTFWLSFCHFRCKLHLWVFTEKVKVMPRSKSTHCKSVLRSCNVYFCMSVKETVCLWNSISGLRSPGETVSRSQGQNTFISLASDRTPLGPVGYKHWERGSDLCY